MQEDVQAVARPPVVFGTAGHIDHGKTTLVKALTGQDTDRLPEEKARGISIDLGFAPLTLPSGRQVAFVDVPGHERFIRNMVAGVHGMDAVLLVVAADEGVMPQTREHLAILELLGVKRGLTVLTKADLVEADWLELVAEDTRQILQGTFLEQSPIMPVSAPAGQGLKTLLEALEALADAVPPRPAGGMVRLPVDRVFTVKGFGTVITGTLTSGRLQVDDMVNILPDEAKARVRGLQVHGRTVSNVSAGHRVAVNLGGVERSDIRRGQVLVKPGTMTPTSVTAVRLRLLPDAPTLNHRARVHAHVGTQEVLARVYFYDRQELLPGDGAWAEIRWEEPVVVQKRDRVLLRSYSPVTTIGGAEVAEVGVHHRRREAGLLQKLEGRFRADPAGAVTTLLVETGEPRLLTDLAREVGLPLDELLRVVGTLPDVWVWEDRQAVHRQTVEAATERVVRAVRRAHAEFPLRPGVTREGLRPELPGWDARMTGWLLEQMASREVVTLDREWVALSGFRPAPDDRDQAWRDAIMGRLKSAGLKPPDIGSIAKEVGLSERHLPEVLQWMVARGDVTKVEDNLYVTREHFEQAVMIVRQALKSEGALGMSALREALGTSRRYAVPLLERMDEARVTRRVGDTRILISS